MMKIPDRGPDVLPGVLGSLGSRLLSCSRAVPTLLALLARPAPRAQEVASKGQRTTGSSHACPPAPVDRSGPGSLGDRLSVAVTQGPTGLVVLPSEIRASIEGWVSNSRVASHAVPRFTRVRLVAPRESSGTGDVIISTEESQRCRQRAVLSVWTDDGPPPESDTLASPESGTRRKGSWSVTARAPACSLWRL